MEQVWRHSASAGVTGLIHPESHFTDSRAGYLRQQTYRRLRRHWQFINELKLFEIAHIFNFGVHVYGAFSEEIKFLNASNLYHPDTVDRSLKHDGSGADPGIKTPEDSWDLRPHKSRIVNVDNSKLNQWAVVLGEYESISAQTPLIYTVNSSADSVLAKLSLARRVGASGPQFSSGWHEKSDRQAGRFELQWGRPADWSNVIYQGPNLHVGTPVYKYPNPSMKSHGDWHNVDIEHLPGDAVPVTSYKPIRDGKYDQLYTH